MNVSSQTITSESCVRETLLMLAILRQAQITQYGFRVCLCVWHSSVWRLLLLPNIQLLYQLLYVNSVSMLCLCLNTRKAEHEHRQAASMMQLKQGDVTYKLICLL